VDTAEIVSWGPWVVPDSVPQGMSRQLRGRTLVVLNMKSGHMHWCEQNYHAVSAQILEARGQHAGAELHRDEAIRHAVSKSPLAV
jgi:hypothetical protein